MFMIMADFQCLLVLFVHGSSPVETVASRAASQASVFILSDRLRCSLGRFNPITRLVVRRLWLPLFLVEAMSRDTNDEV